MKARAACGLSKGGHLADVRAADKGFVTRAGEETISRRARCTR
jgi:hypothetical protein